MDIITVTDSFADTRAAHGSPFTMIGQLPHHM